MRIAVVGATGMLGHHVCDAVLARGHELIVVHRRSSSLERLNGLRYEAREADLANLARLGKAVAKVDAVIMCAAYYPTKPQSWRKDMTAALEQMDVFYRACRIHSLEKVVYIGGSIALPLDPQGKPGTEALRYDEQPRNRNPYLQVKWVLDELAMQQARRGLPLVTAIPSMTLGEYDYGPSTGQLITRIANGNMPAFVEGKRNVMSASDAGRGIVRVCEDGRVGERYLLTGENLKLSDLVARIAQVCKKPPPREAPLKAAQMAARWQAIKYRYLGGELPEISATSIAVMALGQYLDGSKAKDELSFEANMDLDSTIKTAFSWFKSEGMIKT